MEIGQGLFIGLIAGLLIGGIIGSRDVNRAERTLHDFYDRSLREERSEFLKFLRSEKGLEKRWNEWTEARWTKLQKNSERDRADSRRRELKEYAKMEMDAREAEREWK